MDLQNFIAKLAEQFDDTDATEFSSTTKFRELEEWSSFTALCIIAFAKTSYGKTITGTEIRNCTTVEDLFEFVMSK